MNKVEKYFEDKGFNIDELLHDSKVYSIKRVEDAASEIKNAVQNNRHIFVFADYDCDGICSGINMDVILGGIGADYTIRFPKRMSEGYGIKESVLPEIPDGSLLITVDNGIQATSIVDAANKRKIDTIILDHHIASADGTVPQAKIIVDQHYNPYQGEYTEYCGAGLTYMLAEALGITGEAVNRIKILAAIATIQDSVALTGHNRRIVREGLKLINDRTTDFPVFYGLIDKLSGNSAGYRFTEEDVKYYVGPAINALGRLYDDGAKQVFDIFTKTGKIEDMYVGNLKRKQITSRQLAVLMMDLNGRVDEMPNCIVACGENLHIGIIGINASELTERYKRPAIVFTNDENGVLRGSARSVDGVNIKEALDKVSEYLCSYGGHPGAAGLSLLPDKINAFTEAINSAITIPAQALCNCYDIEIGENEVREVFTVLNNYAPYGEGFRCPIIKINDFTIINSEDAFLHKSITHKLIKDTGLVVNGSCCTAVTFDRAVRKQFTDYYNSEVKKAVIIGNLCYSHFAEGVTIMATKIELEKKTRRFLI